MNVSTLNDQDVIAATRLWLERAVIGLNLCPFAKAAYVKQRVHIAVSAATTPEELLVDLARELEDLRDADPAERETSLLVHPRVLQDFYDYNDFLDTADAAVAALELEGEIQVASFHPDYQFDGTAPGDVENCTCCARPASSRRWRATPTSTQCQSAISKPCANSAMPAGSGCFRSPRSVVSRVAPGLLPPALS